jgi:hypothetical protein
MTHPDELAYFSRQISEERKHLSKKNAMSREGVMMKKSEVPVTLYHMMRRAVHPDWMEIKSIRNLFFSIFKIGNVNQRSET